MWNLTIVYSFIKEKYVKPNNCLYFYWGKKEGDENISFKDIYIYIYKYTKDVRSFEVIKKAYAASNECVWKGNIFEREEKGNIFAGEEKGNIFEREGNNSFYFCCDLLRFETYAKFVPK